MKTTVSKTTAEKLFFGILFGIAGIYILWTISTMFIPYETYQNFFKSILN